jgi:hypothetical protein
MRTVRRGVFETNSSSTHSITICSKEDYNAFDSGKLYLNKGGWSSLSKNKDKQFVTRDEAIEILTNNKYPPDKDLKTLDDDELSEYFRDNEIYDSESYFRDNLESFESTYTTKSGEVVVAFGQYGYDG